MKTKSRPKVVLDDVMVAAPKAAPAPTIASSPSQGRRPLFRTTMYFRPEIHDRLRQIAFEQRKSVTDLVGEAVNDLLVKLGG